MNETLATYKAALAADQAFENAIRAAGFKSRWDASHKDIANNPTLAAAYSAKITADQAHHNSWVKRSPQLPEVSRASHYS